MDYTAKDIAPATATATATAATHDNEPPPSRQSADRGSGSADPQIIQCYSHGRVVQMPSLRGRSRGLRERLLRHIAGRAFEAGRVYSEQEVNAALMSVFDDYVALRRYLVESRCLMRDRAGQEYRLAAPA